MDIESIKKSMRIFSGFCLQKPKNIMGRTWRISQVAACIMRESGCSDDSFIDFHAWLMAQRKKAMGIVNLKN